MELREWPLPLLRALDSSSSLFPPALGLWLPHSAPLTTSDPLHHPIMPLQNVVSIAMLISNVELLVVGEGHSVPPSLAKERQRDSSSV